MDQIKEIEDEAQISKSSDEEIKIKSSEQSSSYAYR